MSVHVPSSPTAPFGPLLRHLRKRAGLTQRDLAAALGYSDSLISGLETAQRLPDVAQVAERFVPALGLQDDPVMAARLVACAATLRGEVPPARDQIARTSQPTARAAPVAAWPPLPTPPTTLVGRAAAVQQLCDRLLTHHSRLVTLVGPPGVGKTRLALAVAAQLRLHLRAGAVFVALDTLADPAGVPAAIMAALGINTPSPKPATQQLIEFLRHKELLLVLDNFEQLIAAAALVATLVAECPGLRILVTSRERLHLRAEQQVKVAPLPLDAAVELFVLHAQALSADFALTPTLEPTVAAICLLLDGLPLAIELSAAHLDLLTPAQLLAQLQAHRLDLLCRGAHDLPARQRTLRAAICYSYDLLAEAEQRLFCALGVFVDGFDLTVVQSLGFAEESLRCLLNKNLVHPDSAVQTDQRYRQLAMVREYALERLMDSGEAPARRHQHLHLYLDLAEAVEQQLLCDDRPCWLARLDLDYGNLCAALTTAATLPDVEPELRLAGSLVRYWRWRALISEGRAYLIHALQRAGDQAQGPLVAKALFALGYLAVIHAARAEALAAFSAAVEIYVGLQAIDKAAQALTWQGKAYLDLGEYAMAESCVSQSAQLFRAAAASAPNNGEAHKGLAYALHVHGYVKSTTGDLAAARALAEQSLALYRAQEDVAGVALLLYRLGHLDLWAYDYAAAAEKFQAALATHEALGNRLTVAAIHYFLGYVARKRRAFPLGLRHLGLALQLYSDLGNTGSIVGTLTEIAKIAVEEGKWPCAARLFAKAAALRTAIGETEWKALPAERAEYEAYLAQLRAALAPPVLELEEILGAAMTLPQTLTYATAI